MHTYYKWLQVVCTFASLAQGYGLAVYFAVLATRKHYHLVSDGTSGRAWQSRAPAKAFNRYWADENHTLSAYL